MVVGGFDVATTTVVGGVDGEMTTTLVDGGGASVGVLLSLCWTELAGSEAGVGTDFTTVVDGTLELLDGSACRRATATMLVARTGSWRWMTSAAVRSSWYAPCLNLSGLRS